MPPGQGTLEQQSLPYDYTQFTTVEVVEDGDIILVGEEHSPPGAPRSRQLADLVCTYEHPGSYAIEATHPDASRSSGMRVLQRRAARYQRPLVAIDNGWRSYLDELPASRSEIVHHANIFTHPIDSRGDLNEKAIDNNRQLVYELYGEEVSNAMHERREEAMAGRLREMHRLGFPTPIVAGVGVFHIKSLAEKLRDGIRTVELNPERIQNGDEYL